MRSTKYLPAFDLITFSTSWFVTSLSTKSENVIKSNAGKYLVDLKVIDVYEGSHLAAGKKSFAYNLTFLNRKDTLTDEVVNNAMDKIIAGLENDLDIKVR